MVLDGFLASGAYRRDVGAPPPLARRRRAGRRGVRLALGLRVGAEPLRLPPPLPRAARGAQGHAEQREGARGPCHTRLIVIDLLMRKRLIFYSS